MALALEQDFTIDGTWVHDLSLDKFGQGVVFSRGSGQDMNMDHHKAQNYGSLFTQLRFGEFQPF
jgi:hypothetical protein